MSETDPEAPVPDAEEQRRDVAQGAAEDEPTSLPFDVNEADAVEQHREVELDEDDYR
jgi:hypothetical protein